MATRISSYKEAKALGFKFNVHVLNQPNKDDDGWWYFATAAEAMDFKENHPDPLNDNGGSFSVRDLI